MSTKGDEVMTLRFSYRRSNLDKLNSLRDKLAVAGHAAYSRDDLSSPATVKAFEKVEKIKQQIKDLEHLMYGPEVPSMPVFICRVCMPAGVKHAGEYKHRKTCLLCSQGRHCGQIYIPMGVPLRVLRVLLDLKTVTQRLMDANDCPNSQVERDGGALIRKVDDMFSEPKGKS